MFFSVFLTLTLVGVFATLVYAFLAWNFDHWKKLGIKGPKPKILYGNFPSLVTQKRSIVYDMQDIYRQYRHDEDFVGVYNIRTPELMILNPELVHRILVTDFKSFGANEASTWIDGKVDKMLSRNPTGLKGEKWKECREEMRPALSINRVKAIYPVIQEVCGKLTKFTKEKCKHQGKNGIDTKELSLRFTCEVVSDYVLGVKAQCFTKNPTPIIKMIQTIFKQTTVFTLYAFIAGFWPIIKRFYKAQLCQKQTGEFFTNLMLSAFDIRRKQKMDRLDFLNHMLQLQEKKNLSNDAIVSHAMTFMIDGFETSASVISLCLYQLAKYPIEQEKLRKEIDANVNEKGELDFDKLDTLPYLDQCLHESMRIFVPERYTKKICTEPIVLTSKNGTKVQVKPNDIVLLPFYSFYNDEQYFPNPDEFNPDRFSPENGGVKKYRDMGVFVPFGDGGRICLGMKFVLTQTKAAVAEIVRNFNFKLNPRTRKDNLFHPTHFIGSLQGGVWLDFEERK